MKHRRTRKLILPALQLKLICSFLALSALSLLLQYILLISTLSAIASELPHDGLLMLDGMDELLWRFFAVSAGVLLPLTLLVGIIATHRFAGPVFRFKRFLQEVIDGEKPVDCRLRKGDELQDVCELLNRATEPLREETGVARPAAADKSDLRAAG